jgi:hypothetical protein
MIFSNCMSRQEWRPILRVFWTGERFALVFGGPVGQQHEGVRILMNLTSSPSSPFLGCKMISSL